MTRPLGFVSHDLPLPCPSDGHFIAGFAAGEGSFCLFPRGAGVCASFAIGLDRRDWMTLQWIQDACHGLGCLSRGAKFASWNVRGWADCEYLVRLFDRYPLRSLKQRDFDVWRRAVELRVASGKRSAARGFDWAPLHELAAELRSGRRGGDARA